MKGVKARSLSQDPDEVVESAVDEAPLLQEQIKVGEGRKIEELRHDSVDVGPQLRRGMLRDRVSGGQGGQGPFRSLRSVGRVHQVGIGPDAFEKEGKRLHNRDG